MTRNLVRFACLWYLTLTMIACLYGLLKTDARLIITSLCMMAFGYVLAGAIFWSEEVSAIG